MSTYNPDQKSVPTTDSKPAPSVDSQQSTPGAATSVASSNLANLEIGSMLSISFGLICYLIVGYGAAKLSYDKYGSLGWAILDFFFSGFYYPYYALVLNTPSTPPGIVGARRRR